MNTVNFAHTAYGQPRAPVRSPRGLEYDLLARVTQRLRSAWEGRKQNFPALAVAIADNRQVWSTLALDVAHSGNGLPPPLRAQLFYLYEFTDQHSRKVLAGNASIEVLVDINTAVMRGLRGETGAGL